MTNQLMNWRRSGPALLLALALAGCAGDGAATAPPGGERPTAVVVAIPTQPGAVTAPPATEAPAAPADGWVRRDFAGMWDLEYPAGWAVNDAGLIEGHLTLSGEHEGAAYAVDFSYPIMAGAVPGVEFADLTLELWAQHEAASLGGLPGDPPLADLTVAGAPAKKIVSGTTGAVYVWKDGDKNWRTITIRQQGGPDGAPGLGPLLDRLAAGVR